MPASGNANRSWRLTRVTELLGIEYPIVQAPFGGLAGLSLRCGFCVLHNTP
jgi:hypothetical protein